ncbi:uncharacterized protein LOC119725630 [Patiria miniata]|uniref:Protein quiver n=1 Tax=Patiria miniata TaxID=46514 RepID=A0A913ZMR6_PATMI|nr:uncharacterized protein LOC119725630 [Patiria miniata]
MMMTMRTYLLPAIALFWASFGSTGSLKCFTCSSDVKANCRDPFYNVSVDMPSCGYEISQGVCTKMITAEDVVIRGCGLKTSCPDTGDNGCEQTSGTTRCCCNEDGCNSATTRIVDYLVLTAAVTFAAVVVNVELL